MANRKYPDIEFVNTDTEALVNNLVRAYETFHENITGKTRTLYPADPVRLFILWIADIIMQERIIIDSAAKQNVPRYAEGAYLDSLAEIFKDTERLQPQPAKIMLRFYISVPQLSAQTIPKGTRVTVDGEITFETEESITIPTGGVYADVSAVCITTEIDPETGKEITIGAKANGFMPGQITQIVDLYQFYQRVENITMSDGGTDRETDEAFYERLSDSMESFSTAGSVGAYIYWVKTASQKITDVKPTSPEPGVVDIRVLLENGEFPSEKIISDIYNVLDGKIPLTDNVIVSEPETHPFEIDIIYYITQQQEDSTATIKTNVDKAVESYVKWQTEKMGRDINPDELLYKMKAAGVKRIELNSPAFEVIADNEVSMLISQPNIIYGGVEDE